MTGPKVRVGIVGAGWVAGARHIPGFRSHPQVEVVAVYDRKPERAQALAERAHIPRSTGDWEELLDLGLDAVTVCTPPWTHAELAIGALQKGLHVFTEKPMAMNGVEARSMAEAARTAGRVLCVSHNFLFSRSVIKADRILGPDPEIRYVSALQLSSYARRLPDWYRELPGGLLLDESPHMLYTLRHFLGPLQLDSCRSTGRTADGGLGTCEIRVVGARAPGQITMVFETPVSEWHVGVIGANRVLGLDLFRDICISVGQDRAHKPMDILGTSVAALGGHVGGFASSGFRYASRRLFWGHDTIIRKFVDATLGMGSVPVELQESLDVVDLTDQVLAELGLS